MALLQQGLKGGLLKVTVKTRKDGREVAWFRDILGRRVGTRAGANWVKAEQLAWLANYGIELQQEQLDGGLGSDGAAMPPLKVRGRSFVRRQNGVAQFRNRDTTRRLWGPGIHGHMRDSVRITYVDDRTAKIGITTTWSRIKARANEQKAAWWGWSPESMRKLQGAAATIFQQGLTDYLVQVGLIGAGSAPRLALPALRRSWRRAA